MPSQKEVIFVSDLHIKSDSCHVGKKFSAFLSQINPKTVSHLIVLGDLFDFCFGRLKYFQQKFYNIGQGLENLSQKGVKVIYIQGNHEFSIEKIGWKHIKFITEDSYVLNLEDKTLISLSHGDKLIAPKKYFFYMSLVRSNIFLFLASFFPGKWMDTICMYLSKASRSSHKNKKLDTQKLFAAAIALQKKQGSQFTILGHYHMPIEKTYHENGQLKKVFILDSWTTPNFLRFNGNYFERLTI